MVGSRWLRRLGPGIAALGALAVVASAASGAQERGWEPPPCAGPPAIAAGGDRHGTWYRLDPVLDEGRLVGQRLAFGRTPDDRTHRLSLPPESFAAGPFGSAILVGADDGRRSAVRLIDPATDCAWTVAETSDVVRRATVTPDGIGLVEFRVGRPTRADLGVTVRPLTGGAPVTLFGPIAPDPAFGPTWVTELHWSAEGDRLAVQSCGAHDCRTRIVEPASGHVATVASPGIGDLVGVAGDRLIAHAACGGFPCALLSIPIGGGRPVVVDPDAGQAVLVRDSDGTAVIVHETGPDRRSLAVATPEGRRVRTFPPDAAGRVLLAAPSRSGAAIDIGLGLAVLVPDGPLPLDEPSAAMVLRLADGALVPLEEVSR